MINVISLLSDRAGCGQYRVIFPAEAVNRRDSELGVHVEHTDHLQADATFSGSEYRIRHIGVPGGINVVSFQRPTTAAVAGAMQWLKAHRPDVGLVIELDDDLAGLPANNAAYPMIHGKATPIEGYQWFLKALACADVLTVSTPELAKRYGTANRPAFVVRNAVPPSMLDQGPSNALMYKPGSNDNSDRIIGWAGYVGTHTGDPESTCNALAEFVGVDKTDGRTVCFRNIGPKDGVAKAFGLHPSDVEASGWLKPHEYRVALGSMDIGVVPLADTRFNASKCVDADMRVTTDKGIVTAGELEVGTKVWRGRWRAVEAVDRNLPQPGLLITTVDGYQMRLTPEHRMLSGNQWRRADELSVGDRLEMEAEAVGPQEWVRAPWPADSRMSRSGGLGVAERFSETAFLSAEDGPKIDVTPRWGRLLGAFAGDGSVSRKSVLQISCDGQDQDWIDLLMTDFQAIGTNPTTEQVTTWGGEMLRRRSVRVASSHLLRVLTSWGLTTEKEDGHLKRVVRIPEVIWRSPKEVIAEFLAGYFEADGHCTSTGVEAVSKDEQMIRDVQRLLLVFGITSVVKQYKTRAQNGYTGTAWKCTLRRAEADLFAKEIGFRSQRKTGKLAEITGKPHSNAYRPIAWHREIVAIEPCFVNPVDIQVEGEEFALAGFVSHNSAIKGLEMLAAGVPVIASKLPEYVELQHSGAPVWLVKNTRKEWSGALRRVLSLTDGELRELAESGREYVRRYGTTDHRAEDWATAWTAAARMALYRVNSQRR